MSDMNPGATGKVLGFASVVEIGTGLALMADPAIVARLLLGAELSGLAPVLGRCFGIAILSLGIACWPNRGGSSGFRGMLIYNALIAFYLAYLGTLGNMRGPLLWPAALLHAAVALALAWSGRIGSGTRNA